MTNIRFTDYHSGAYAGGPVKLTLSPGQSLTVHQLEHHEEGYREWTDRYEYAADEPVLYLTSDESSSDCDGNHGSSHVYEACVVNGRVDCRDNGMVNWQTAGGSNYDQFAELAGY